MKVLKLHLLMMINVCRCSFNFEIKMKIVKKALPQLFNVLFAILGTHQVNHFANGFVSAFNNNGMIFRLFEITFLNNLFK